MILNILIITTFFPPDTSIGAVRPYMFAKYLLQFGHQVTVLRSGLLFCQPDHSYPPPEGLQIISYLGDDSPAEVFAKNNSYKPGRKPFDLLPSAVRFLIEPIYIPYWMMRTKIRLTKQKRALDALRNEHFDIVFATYSGMENVWAGTYAAKLFNCKWILDLRDPIADGRSQWGPVLAVARRIQDRALSRADACTVVSNGIRSSSRCLRNSGKVHTIYNGYEPLSNSLEAVGPLPGFFSICYTGAICRGSQTIVPLLRALRQLSERGQIQLDRVRLEYAGRTFEAPQAEAEALHMEQCLTNHGYVTREEVARIQSESDIFLLLSWNRKNELGMLCGKFYEGIRAGKPILSIVSGDVPNSELDQINQRFHYGFCYEESRDAELFPQLCDFLLQAYTQKMEHGAVDYAPSEELSTRFRYDTLTRRLEAICKELVYGESSKDMPS